MTDPTNETNPAMMRMRAEATFGQVVMALSALPRYRHLPLSEVDAMVLQPLMRNRIVMASTAPRNDAQTPEAPGDSAGRNPAGLAIWASVSEEVDARIQEQIGAGVFPVRLRPQDWTSGSVNWLLDVVAPDQQTVLAILTNFRKLAGDGDLRLHPLVTRLVPREALERMGAARMTPQGSKAPAAPAESAGVADA